MNFAQITEKELQGLKKVYWQAHNRLYKLYNPVKNNVETLDNLERSMCVEKKVRPFVEVSKALFPKSRFVTHDDGRIISQGRRISYCPETDKASFLPSFEKSNCSGVIYSVSLCREDEVPQNETFTHSLPLERWRQMMVAAYERNPNQAFFIVDGVFDVVTIEGQFSSKVYGLKIIYANLYLKGKK